MIMKKHLVILNKKFIAQITNSSKLVYTYKTCATDTNNVKFIFQAVKDVFITVYLVQMGFLSDSSNLPASRTSSIERRQTSTKKFGK